jgi:hypothetical protein
MALVIKKSRIPGAGKGLFTTKFIPKGKKIIEYRGEIIKWKEYLKRVKEEKDGYLFFVRRDKCIDAYNTPQYKARYANDARGLIRIPGLKNNAQYEIHDDRCFIVATRDIQPGEEILVDYTKEYWDAIRYNIRKGLYKKKKIMSSPKKKKK